MSCFQAHFPAQDSIAARGPLRIEVRDAILALQSEMRDYKTLARSGFSYAPTCHEASLSCCNAISHSFVVVSWIEGPPLNWNATWPARPLRDKILDSDVNYTPELT